MRSRALCVLTEQGHSLADLRAILQQHHYTGFPIVNSTADMVLRGYISRNELRVAVDRALGPMSLEPYTPCFFGDLPLLKNTGSHLDLTSWMDAVPIKVEQHTPLNTVFDLFKKLGLRVCLVDHGCRLVGIITKKDILQHISTTFQKKHINFVNRSL